MIYEIINPSDGMTIEADDPKVAMAAVIFLGEGKIGLRDEEGEAVLPLLLFNGDVWLKTNFPDFDGFVSANYLPIAKCLETLIYCDIRDRKAIMAAVGPEASVEALARYNDAKRGSLSDWGGYAHDLAKHFRKKAAGD